MSEPIRLGMIGCGGMAGAHRDGFRELWEHGLRDFRIVATCDIDAGRAAAMADSIAEFQGERPAVFTAMEEMLARTSELQAVDICSLHRNHHTLAVPCLEAGLHVTLEKPLAITLRAGKAMLDAAARAGTVFQVAENYRRSLENRAIHWALQQGRIGRPRMIYWIDVGERLWYWGWREHKDQAGGGWSLDGGVHYADLFRYHLGPVRSLFAEVKAFHPVRYRDEKKREGPIPVDVEDTTIAVLQFENGCLGQWTSTSAAPGAGFGRHVIYGEEGSLTWGQGLKTRTQETSMEALIAEHQAALSEEEKERLFPRGITNTVATELQEFLHAIQGRGTVETDGWEGYRAEAISLALYESAHLGRPVTLAEVENLEVEGYQAEINAGLGLGG
jgi:predicted dehydrogenase